MARGRGPRGSGFGSRARWTAPASAATARRAALTLTFALASGLACGGAATGPARQADLRGCDPARIERCEQAIAARVLDGERVDRETAAAYAAARRVKREDDAWAAAWDALEAVPQVERGAVVLREPGAQAFAAPHARVIEVAALSDPGAVGADVLLAALADGASCDALARVGPRGARVAFGRDPLAPFMLPVAPVVAARAGQLAADFAVERAVRASAEAAAAGRYVDAARAGDEVRALTASADEESAARGRLWLERLRAAGALLDAPAAVGEAGAESAPSAGGSDGATPYGAYARLRGGAVDPSLARVVVAGVAAPSRARTEALLSGARCAETAVGSAPEHPHDLVLAALLAAAPEPRPLAARAARRDTLTSAAKTTARSGASWAYAPLWLGAGVDDVGGAMRAATAVHLRSLRDLARSAPARFSGIAAASLATPAIMADEALARDVTELAAETAEARARAAPDATSLLSTAAAAVFSSASAPPALREPVLEATLRATGARLSGDFARQGGWGVAALYAADAAGRAATGHPVDVGHTATEVARALATGDASRPELAALTAALARYVALAADPETTARRHAKGAGAPDGPRLAARRALRAAIAGLGAPGEAPNNVLDDVTDLADGLALGLSIAASERAHVVGLKADAAACQEGQGEGPSPAVLRALAPLGDVRQRILSHPRFRGGDAAWIRRVRLLVTLLSDALDLAQRDARTGDARRGTALTISAADARAHVEGALTDAGVRAYAPAVAGAYVIARAIAVDRGRKGAPMPTGAAVARVAEDLAIAAASGGGEVARILGASGTRDNPAAGSGGDVATLLARGSRTFAAAGHVDEADLCLLFALVVEAVTDAPPSAELREAARARKSRVAWALDLVAEMDGARAGHPPDASRFAPALRDASTAACDGRAAEPATALATAYGEAIGGRRAEAARRVDALLDEAERAGLDLARVAYRYEARAEGRVFGLSFDVSSGFGVLRGATQFQIDFGLTSGSATGAPTSRTSMTSSPIDDPDDAARAYVASATLAAAWHFSVGEAAAGARDAARAVSAASHGVRLGDRRVRPDPARPWGGDASGAAAVAAELAAAAGHALLAADLWTLVARATPVCPKVAACGPGVAKAATDAARTLETLLTPPPPGFAAADPIVVRARASLRALARALPCGPRRDPAGFEEVACGGYGRALGLRAAGALGQHPRLARGGRGATCEAFAAVDRFLASADHKTYDPDAFTSAAAALDRAGLAYDAAVLLARHKRRGHCSGRVVALDRKLSRAPEIDAGLRADLLSDAMNCAGGGDPELPADVAALDAAMSRLADPARSLHVMLSVADLAARDERWELLAAMSAQPDFVARWVGRNDAAAAAALVIARAARAVDHRLPADAALAIAERLLCTAPPKDRAALCEAARRLAAPGADAATAKQAIRDVVARGATRRTP